PDEVENPASDKNRLRNGHAPSPHANGGSAISTDQASSSSSLDNGGPVAFSSPYGRAMESVSPGGGLSTTGSPALSLSYEEKAFDEYAMKFAEARMKGYEGDPCPECSSFTLLRNGSCLKCDTCGSTTGCS